MPLSFLIPLDALDEEIDKPKPLLTLVWLPLLAAAFLVSISLMGYVWFHSLAELFTIVIGIALYLIALHTFTFTRNAFLYCIAVGFFWSSVIDIFHMLTYEGMGKAANFRPDTPPLLWMCARSLQASAFLLAPNFLQKHQLPRGLFALFGLSAVIMVVAVFNGLLPVAWIAGQGLTPIKIAWEWVLIVAFGITALQLMRYHQYIDNSLKQALLGVLALGAGTELCFTWYVEMYGLSNMVGHILKLWAYWAMLWVISQYMLKQPRTLLREQALMLQTVVDQVPGVTLLLQRLTNGIFQMPFVSSGVVHMLELTADDVKQDAARALSRLVPADARVLEQIVDESYASMKPWRATWQLDLPRQGKRWHSGNSSEPNQRPDGSCVWVVTVQDVTDQKIMEQELTRHRDELAHLVEERTDELNKALIQANAAARAKSEFLSNMSHEIRTPLNAIVGLAQVGQRTPHLSVAWPYLAQIQDSGRMLMTLINDVLDMAKIEAGKLRLEMRPIDLNKVFERATKLIRPIAESKGLALNMECSEHLPRSIMGDDTRLIQVLLNLLGNAVKFTEKGEVRLACTSTMTGDSGWLLLSVIDTGVGIGKEQMLRLFHPFEQGDVSTTRHFGGTGLGLTICRQIVELMGGRIDLSSQPGVGSCFTVRLPIEAAILNDIQHRPALDELGSNEPRLAGLRVLAAEDDEVNQWVLRELLQQEGATITVVGRGDLALKLLASPQPFDVFITDLQMPGLNGYETTQGALKLRPQLPVLGLTAFAMPEDRSKCLAAGMFDHISKPIDVDVLIGAVRRALFAATPIPIKGSLAEPLMTSAKPSTLVDWDSLEKSLRKPESQIKFLNTFMANYADVPAKLRQLLQNGDQQEVQRLAHKVQGAAGFLAAKSAHQQARALEERIMHTHTLPSNLIEGLAVTLEGVLVEVAGRIESMALPA